MNSSEWATLMAPLLQKIEDEIATARMLQWQAYVLKEHSKAIRRDRERLNKGTDQKYYFAPIGNNYPPKMLYIDIDVGEVWDL